MKSAADDLQQGGIRHLRLDGEACPSGQPYPHAYDARCSPALPKMTVPPAADPLDFQLPTVGRLRNALEAAEHERDQAQDEVTGLCQALAVLGADLNEAEAQRDRARSDVELVAADLRMIAADRDRYRRSVSAALLERDQALDAFDSATATSAELAAMVVAAYSFADEIEKHHPLRSHPATYADELRERLNGATGAEPGPETRVALTVEGQRLLERLAHPSLSVKTYAPNILTVSDTGRSDPEATRVDQ